MEHLGITALHNSRVIRKRLLVAAALFVLLPAVLVSAIRLNVWPVDGKAEEARVVMIDSDHGGHCHLIYASCSGVSMATSAWLVGTGSVSIARDIPLWEVNSPEFQFPAEAFVLLPTPPPRSA